MATRREMIATRAADNVATVVIGLALSGGRDSALALIVAWVDARRRFTPLAGTPAHEA